MSNLRAEVIESQKVKSELLKWKLVIVAALGAAGLGFTQGGARDAYLVLLLIPPVCFYADLLCRHVTLRSIVIGTFIRLGFCGVETAYERFVVKTTSIGPKKLNVFALEDWALDWSTIVLSLLVMIVGLTLPDVNTLDYKSVPVISVRVSYVVQGMFIVSGFMGILLTLVARGRYGRRMNALRELANDQRVVEELGSIIAKSTPPQPEQP